MYWKVGCIYFSYLLMKIGNRVLTVIEGIGAYTETLTSAHDLCIREGGTLTIDDEIENGQIFTNVQKNQSGSFDNEGMWYHLQKLEYNLLLTHL